jgi:hypothetical protein
MDVGPEPSITTRSAGPPVAESALRIRSQRSEDRSQKSEIRDQRSEVSKEAFFGILGAKDNVNDDLAKRLGPCGIIAEKDAEVNRAVRSR